ncbi:MAG: site-2 protease family protein [Paludisphaera borealis]|uniref:site-2 protease family protein n=1 Tax=Paludisphaera borealis TaxID=1387353 RepID=UPI0028517063|nr:site-2 protease family protein [Paludisphaera borealis]MDR3621401.1 site-2 protease family protein [Paludisphaera borealis]
MSWSWKLARVAGIPIYVHWTFLILIAWLVIAGTLENNNVSQGISEAAFVLALFGCVVLHELGHALTARRFGVKTSDITLLPIGGVARLERMPEKPSQELLVALAGPAVNVVIVALLLIFGIPLQAGVGASQELVHAGFWPKLLMVNVFLAAFNLLPAFPMDGGRVLRALLAMRLPYARATRLAANIGQMMAIGFGLLGLSGQAPILLFIAIFVWIGAEAEAQQVAERAALKGVSIRDAMITEFHTLDADDTLGRAADLLLAGTQQDFPIAVDGDPVLHVLTRADLMSGLSQRGRDGLARDFAPSALPTVESSGSLSESLTLLRSRSTPCLQVVDRGRVVGLLTLENVGELLMVRAALGEPQDGSVEGGETIY